MLMDKVYCIVINGCWRVGDARAHISTNNLSSKLQLCRDYAVCLLPVADCPLPTAYYPLPIACCLWLNRFWLLLLWLLYECFVSGWKLITGEARNYVLAWVWQHSGQWTHFLGDSFKQAVFVPLGNIHMWAPGGYLQDSCSVLLHAQKWKRHTEWQVVLNEKENLPVKRT